MSTRRLIVTALICGLAILLAGSVMLVRLARDRERLTIDTLSADTPATVGGVRVQIVEHDRGSGTARVVVALQAPAGAGLADAGQGFTLNIGGLRDRAAVDGAQAPSCEGLPIEAGRSASCTLGFVDRAGSATLGYAHGGDQAEWSLGR